MNVEVVFLPPMTTDLPRKACVVIDVLRATSTLVSMFEAGAARVTLAESVPAALSHAASIAERPLVCGESGGLPPAGFDRGNSPREYPPGSLEGRELVMCTSNGTRAMHLVVGAPVVLAGSLFNATAVAEMALREARERALDLALVCSGDILGTRFALDDAFCAGYLLTLMLSRATGFVATDPWQDRRFFRLRPAPGADPRDTFSLDETALVALRLYRSYLMEVGLPDPSATPPRDAILRAFWDSNNGHVLAEVGLSEDVEYCAQVDISRRVPRLRAEGGLMVLE